METALLLPLLLLVKVNCQTFPYVSFMGQTLADHSYVDLSLVGSADDNSDGVVCRTDLSTCCSGGQGIHRGNWSFPDGTLLPSIGNSVPIGLCSSESHHSSYHCYWTNCCDIPTIAVHHVTDISVGETVYVGLYLADGGKLKHRLAADINLPIVLVLANTHQNSTPPSLLHCSEV